MHCVWGAEAGQGFSISRMASGQAQPLWEPEGQAIDLDTLIFDASLKCGVPWPVRHLHDKDPRLRERIAVLKTRLTYLQSYSDMACEKKNVISKRYGDL